MKEKIYKLEIEEILTKVIEVSATSQEEAYEKVYEQYHEEEIVLSSEDWVETNCYLLNENNDRICEF